MGSPKYLLSWTFLTLGKSVPPRPLCAKEAQAYRGDADRARLGCTVRRGKALIHLPDQPAASGPTWAGENSHPVWNLVGHTRSMVPPACHSAAQPRTVTEKGHATGSNTFMSHPHAGILGGCEPTKGAAIPTGQGR